MDNTEIQFILRTLGERVAPASRLVLVGGGALALLGSPRLTIDIDFVGDDVHPNELHRTPKRIPRRADLIRNNWSLILDKILVSGLQ